MERVILHGGNDADATCSVWKLEGIVTDPSEKRSAHTTTMIRDVSLTNCLFISDRNLRCFPPTKKYSEIILAYSQLHQCHHVIGWCLTGVRAMTTLPPPLFFFLYLRA